MSPLKSETLTSLITEERLRSPLLIYGLEHPHLQDVAVNLAHQILRLSQNHTTEKKIQSNSHPDLHILSPEGKSNLYSIETIQSFIKEVSLPPLESSYAVYLFFQAERMLPVHANALLKTLEEKKHFAAIILTTTNLAAILPTIQSRCQKISLSTSSNTSSTHPSLLTAFEQSSAKQYSALFKTIELIEKEEIPLHEITTALLEYHRDCIKNSLGNQNRSHATLTFEALSKLVETAHEAHDRNVKLKHILEYLLVSVQGIIP